MKSKSRNILVIFVALLIVLLLFAGFVFSKPAEERAYDKYLKKNAGTTIKLDSYTKAKLKKFKHKTYIDLDEDGTKEVILTFYGEGESVDDFSAEDGFICDEYPAIILTYHDKKVKILGKFAPAGGGRLLYLEVEHYLIAYDRCSGEEHIQVYQLFNGEFTEKLTMDHYQPHHYDLDSEKDFYFMNGQKIKKSEFESTWNHYYGDATIITYD